MATLGRRPQCDVAGDDEDGYATPPQGRANGILQNVGELRGIGDQFAVVTAFPKQFLRMGLMKIAAPDFAGRNLRGDRQHGGAAAVSVEQSIDEGKIARPTRPGTYRKLARDLRFTCGGESGHLFMSNVNPIDRLSFAQRLGQTIQTITDYAPGAVSPPLH